MAKIGDAKVCSHCGGTLIQRDDDKPATIRNRLDVYHRQTAPLIDYYRGKGALRTVDGDRPRKRYSRRFWSSSEAEMIYTKNPAQIQKMRDAGKLLHQVLEHLKTMIKPGMTTLEIDREAERMIRAAGATPSFKGFEGFPFTICSSQWMKRLFMASQR